MKKILTAFLLILPLTSYAADKVYNLNGIKLCVPEKYAPPSMSFSIGTDKQETVSDSKELFVQFEAKELKKAIPSYKPDTYLIQGKRRYTAKGVTIVNTKDIAEQSLVQKKVIELIKNKKTKISYLSKLKLYKIEHDPVVKDFVLLNSKKLPKKINTTSLHKWIIAYCRTQRKEKNRYECNIRRISGSLLYDVNIPSLNMRNRKAIEQFIQQKIYGWYKACKNK